MTVTIADLDKLAARLRAEITELAARDAEHAGDIEAAVVARLAVSVRAHPAGPMLRLLAGPDIA